MTSPHTSEQEAYCCAHNLCVFSHIQKGIPGLTLLHGPMQHLSLCTITSISDVMGVLETRQSIPVEVCQNIGS